MKEVSEVLLCVAEVDYFGPVIFRVLWGKLYIGGTGFGLEMWGQSQMLAMMMGVYEENQMNKNMI